MDPETHKRFLQYRDRHGYFGGSTALLGREDFLAVDKEFNELDAKGEKRDDDEEVRFLELAKLLFRD